MADAAIKYPEGLAQIKAIIEATLVDEGVEMGQALSLARAVTERIRLGLGGTYIPRGTSFDVDRMRQEAGLRWDGTNTVDLCRKLGISERRLRQLHEEFTRRKA